MTNSDERIDALIDDVAGRMTEGTPAADFTARVLQRIDERQPRLRWRWVWVAAPLAAAAVILIAMQVVRLKPLDTARGPELVKGPDATGVPPVVRLKPDTTDVSSEVRLPARAKRPSVRVAEGPDAAEMRTIDALAPPRVDVTPLEATRLDAAVDAPESIELEQLEPIAPIAVTPLSDNDTQRLRPH
jgi:hypothetical protein